MVSVLIYCRVKIILFFKLVYNLIKSLKIALLAILGSIKLIIDFFVNLLKLITC